MAVTMRTIVLLYKTVYSEVAIYLPLGELCCSQLQGRKLSHLGKTGREKEGPSQNIYHMWIQQWCEDKVDIKFSKLLLSGMCQLYESAICMTKSPIRPICHACVCVCGPTESIVLSNCNLLFTFSQSFQCFSYLFRNWNYTCMGVFRWHDGYVVDKFEMYCDTITNSSSLRWQPVLLVVVATRTTAPCTNICALNLL
jgi:hypothetical protein